MSKSDINQTPNYKTQLAIANHPEAWYPNPVEIAFAIEVEVNDNFVNDPEFPKIIDAYVKTLTRIYDQLIKDLPVDVAGRVFAQMATKFALRYTC